jgi:hypothetical protein
MTKTYFVSKIFVKCGEEILDPCKATDAEKITQVFSDRKVFDDNMRTKELARAMLIVLQHLTPDQQISIIGGYDHGYKLVRKIGKQGVLSLLNGLETAVRQSKFLSIPYIVNAFNGDTDQIIVAMNAMDGAQRASVIMSTHAAHGFYRTQIGSDALVGWMENDLSPQQMKSILSDAENQLVEMGHSDAVDRMKVKIAASDVTSAVSISPEPKAPQDSTNSTPKRYDLVIGS